MARIGRPPKGTPRPLAAPEKVFQTYRMEDLGYDFPDTGNWLHDQLQVEFACFRIGHTRKFGGLGKFGHFKRIVDLLWNNPELECQKRVIWNPWIEKMLREACEPGSEELGVAGPTSAGKCCSPEQLVLMFDGSRKMFKDIVPGNQVMGDDGTPRNVLEVHAGRGPMLKVTPWDSEREPWYCTENHKMVFRSCYVEGEFEEEARWFNQGPKALFSEMRLFRPSNKVLRDIIPNSSEYLYHSQSKEEFGFSVEPAGEGDWVGFSVDGNHRFLLGDFTVTHNSDPFALWVVVNFIVDPTHVLALVMSTTLDGAKLRIWKTLKEYVSALPDFPGKPLWSTNRIQGPNYDPDDPGFGESSGIILLASEKSKEKEALEKMIGIKAPRTGAPDYSLAALKKQFPDLALKFDDDTLEELLPRLVNLTEDRIGKLFLVVDEATGLPESLLSAINLNMKPGNVGFLQVIMLGNPNLHWDSFGRFCEPKVGWDKVGLDDEEWETVTGGKCIRFNGEKNPRIVEKNDLYSWMLTQERIEGIAKDCGGKLSLGYYRMVLGMWSPEGSESGIYSQADVESHGAMSKEPVIWGFKRPSKHSTLDCAFSGDGDRAFATFGQLGIDPDGRQVLERTETKVIDVDVTSTVPVNYQIARKWRDMCEQRGIPPENAAYDRSGGGIVFGDIVVTQWSPLVQGITASGKPLKDKVAAEKDQKKKDSEVTFANRATQIWYSAHPFFRSGQIRGVSPTLAKEICSRQHEKSSTGDGRTLKIESKRVYKARTGVSPDESDSFFLMVEHCRMKHGFKAAERAAAPDPAQSRNAGKGTWNALVARARRITYKKGLRGA